MTRLQRSGETSPFGGMTAEIPKMRVPEETFLLATKAAREAGMNLSEWVRTLVMVRVHGVDVMANMHLSRLKVVAGMGSDSDE